MEIIGEKVLLRPIVKDDIHLVAAWRNKPRVRHAFFNQQRISLAGQEKWYESYVSRADEILFVIENKDGKPVGTVGFSKIDLEARSAELGRLMIGDDTELGKGLASDAVWSLLNYGFSELALEHIWLEVFSWNEIAIKVYAACGFRILKDRCRLLHADGREQKVTFMSITRDDWLKRR